MQAAEKEVSNLQKQLSQATKHQEKLATQVQDAHAAQKAAEEKVSQAGLEASNARKLVEAVRARLWHMHLSGVTAHNHVILMPYAPGCLPVLLPAVALV